MDGQDQGLGWDDGDFWGIPLISAHFRSFEQGIGAGMGGGMGADRAVLGAILMALAGFWGGFGGAAFGGGLMGCGRWDG